MTVVSGDAGGPTSADAARSPRALWALELDLLLSNFTLSVTGEARSVVLQGPPGSGKAELMSAFADQARAAGATVLHRSCVLADRDRDYGAVSRLTTLPADVLPAPSALSQLLFDVICGHLEAGPVVIMFEQMEWCDEASQRWLDLLLKRCRGRQLLIVVSQRPAMVPSWWHLLEGAGPALSRRKVVLENMSDNGVRDAVQQWWPHCHDVQFVQECRRQSIGLPGLLHALLLTLHDSGSEPGSAGTAEAAVLGSRILAQHTVAVLKDHPAHVQRVAEALAVLGREDIETLALLAPVPAALVPGTLRLLRQEGLLSPDDADSEQIRSAVLAGMSAGVRAAWHERAARLLNDTGGSADEISVHLLRLPEIPEHWMRVILRQVADRAEGSGDVLTSTRLRVRLVETGADEDVIAFARVLVHLDPVGAHQLVGRALGAARDVRARAALAVQLGRSAIVIGTVPEAVRTLSAALAELRSVIGAEPDDADRRLWMRVESALLILACNEVSTIRSGGEPVRARDDPYPQTCTERRGSRYRPGHEPVPGAAIRSPSTTGPLVRGHGSGSRNRSAQLSHAGPVAPPGGAGAGTEVSALRQPQIIERLLAGPPALRSARMPGPTMADSAEAQARARDCGWLVPDAGPDNPLCLPWWFEAAVREGCGLSGGGPRIPGAAGNRRSGGRSARILTPSERRVAELAADGASNREIAAVLVLALRTVEIHLTSVYRKFGITGRADLADAWDRSPTNQIGA